MHIIYETLRIGNKRKDPFKEKLLSINIEVLKKDIQEALREEYHGSTQTINIAIIIPQKGLSPKFDESHIKDSEIRKILNSNFGKYIRHLTLEEIRDNLYNY
ncbi:hypothetical protein ACFSTE_15865 [Aquimarina hainanensis]|uniref:Uncharacterized protein n=1 Tax=Aquimarina hainanensis TaxID=1578017 RepID=A0ABW5NA58_9FLAO